MSAEPGPRFATIDVGTNTVLLLVAERRGGALAPVLERAEITRLGRGVDACRGARLGGRATTSNPDVAQRRLPKDQEEQQRGGTQQ